MCLPIGGLFGEKAASIGGCWEPGQMRDIPQRMEEHNKYSIN
ncbi:hypothetical protein AVEN_35228-1, partial [Araneus ventricosus]